MNLYDKDHLSAPVCPKKPHKLEKHGDVRTDPYYWLNDREDPEVIKYLEEENEYTRKMLEHTEDFQDQLFKEIIGRIKQTDMSVPYLENGYYYLTRFEEGMEYPIFSRKKGDLEAEEEVMLNVNELAEPFEYYQVGARQVSPDNRYLAYGEDTVSRRIYTIRFKDLHTGEMLKDRLENTSGLAVWANDNRTVFYSVKDETLRSYKIFRHTLGQDQSEDVEIFHEDDPSFITMVYKSKSNDFLIIGSWHTETSEYRILSADHPHGEFRIFHPRDTKGKVEYYIAHMDDHWFIRTNYKAQNFRLMTCGLDNTGIEYWEERVPGRADVLLEDMEVFRDYLVLTERINGITQLAIHPNEGEKHYISFPEDAHLTYVSTNKQFDTELLRIGYQSMTTPNSIFDYNMKSRQRELLKQEEVLGGFESSDYDSKRLFAPSRDGQQIPVSLVYRKDKLDRGENPILVYGYGSYGHSMEPYFSSVRLSLLDRGFVYAIVHVRGGEELGRQWYEDGKFLNKKNTFFDFIDATEFLLDEHWADREKVFAMGGSAGGLLMGAVINERPDLWKGIVAAVPFVDVLTTMLDESIPLTAGEYAEWGNPNEKKYYNYIKSYSPYDNVEAKAYPAMLVTTGLHDSQVQYWEPAKWVAKLRDLKTDNNPLLLHTNMSTGHSGESGRFRRFKETAMMYAFVLDLVGIR